MASQQHSRRGSSHFDACDSSRAGRSSAAGGGTKARAPLPADRRCSSSSRGFAPGLAKRKAKVDPYDPEGMLEPQDAYTFLEDKRDAEVKATWSTIDPAHGTRTFDGRWYEQTGVSSGNVEGSVGLGYQTPAFGHHAPADAMIGSAERSVSAACSGDGGGASTTLPGQATLDARFEDPEIDVDPDVRARFRSMQTVMDERLRPRSAFEQRNQLMMPRRAAPTNVTVLIGERVVKRMERKGDVRAQYQDRFGNYVGENLGPLKKHLVEDRRALIELRDQEMVRATQEKRALQSLGPTEQEEQRLVKRRAAPMKAFLSGVEQAKLDGFEYDAVPDIYLRRVTAEEIAAWSARAQSSSAISIASDDPFRTDDDVEGISETVSVGGSAKHSGQASGSDQSTSGRSGSIVRVINSGRTGSRTGGSSSGVHSISSSTISNQACAQGLMSKPRLVPAGDILMDQPSGYGNDVSSQYDKARFLCSTRGRVVSVTLHHPVVFSPAAVVARVFGGILQEIQLHPDERTALIVFLLPREAETFVRHVQTVRERDAQRYRQLQIDGEWYGGNETKAVLPIQRGVFQTVMREDATRVLKLEWIPVGIKREELAEELRLRIGTVPVNVALVKDPRRHIREMLGHSAIVEFASIRDACLAFRRFRAGEVPGYETNPVSWLRDPCDRPASKSPCCGCLNYRPSKAGPGPQEATEARSNQGQEPRRDC